MLGSRQDSLYDPLQNTFRGVRFVLLGFDPLTERKVRSKLVNGGGVDIGQYNQDCTHVIVDKIVYCDPVCVAARDDGKTLVTGLWVDHSYDTGMPIDASSIMYRPLIDLNGIPGAKSVVVCLTGYQRQDRDDIMTMVGLMGAQFSKPLVANKVTHLVCYKFEGEKYELAKKMKKIKLVNHRWLQDCLKAWEIVPEAEYDQSGYELEIAEAEAKDSEEETENLGVNQPSKNSVKGSSYCLPVEMPKGPELPVPSGRISATVTNFSHVDNAKDILTTAGNSNRSADTSSFNAVNKRQFGLLDDAETVVLSNVLHGNQSEQVERTPVRNRVGNELASTSGSGERCLQTDGTRLNAKSYSRKTPGKSTLPVYSKVTLNTVNRSPETPIMEHRVKEENGLSLDFVQSPSEGAILSHEEGFGGVLPQKRKTDASHSGNKLPKVCHDFPPCGIGIPTVSDKTQEFDAAALGNGPLERNSPLSSGNQLDTSTYSVLNPDANSSAAKSTTGNNLLKGHSSTSKTMSLAASEIKAHQAHSGRIKTPNSVSKSATEDCATGGSLNAISKIGNQQNLQQSVEGSSLNMKAGEIEKTHSQTSFDLQEGGNSSSITKQYKRNTVVKKRLGSRSNLSTSSTANKKGSIYSNDTDSQNDAAIFISGGQENGGNEKPHDTDKFQMCPSRGNIEAVMEIETGKTQNAKTETLNEETEAPDAEDEMEFQNAVSEKSAAVQKVDLVMEEKLEGTQRTSKKAKYDTADTDAKVRKNGIEPGRAARGKKNGTGESVSKEDALKGKTTKGKNRPLGQNKIKTLPTRAAVDSNKCVLEEGTLGEDNIEKTEIGGKGVSKPVDKSEDGTIVVNKIGNSVEMEKENKPVFDGGQNKSGVKQHVENIVAKCSKKAKKTNCKDGKDTSSMQGVISKRVKTEPVWFIVSGHRLQRKEFQQVIRRLKGRSCRDSHHWSYQATHFIAPDPIRRTEKFFAAAASGRWILKTDYLAASSQEGKFLSEEQYEWHKSGLSEDGAINLEAPRKWRLLREKTGHGALYGMHMIIYGECIAPSLDTLKRVVKAGDGTIVATSPPYSRFLKSGVDFAIVSPSMPRVDLWVQEFLRHEIPCVVADYLVEYVCKPGFSLERHVLYNTHAWAEKSFANMQRRSEETVLDLKQPNDHATSDLPCEVCGSLERGEVMLICGDESGSVGCGVGIHIDCCDPPLEAVPEDDWFCRNCSKTSMDSSPNGRQ